ncbi:MAG: hypothetical protein D5R99_08265 [Methanocalculus sp. MSAO_Arc1]|uniref:hypothetical protein n=2 Tax=Methanocalculaceae TaxID=1460864 RepID=UPI000FF0CF5A|nr:MULTISPECIES: hypothetical protein [unclassified Methanocalculus]MCP1661763.1 hypothetical protein [Methanocalculus sp. AMF5]RQD79441.1 MAG: hypothetical protein D5R99_08265 [Methanocalculus sp. MSAO_Arc1]
MLMEKNEFSRELDYLYSKSLVLESISDFHPVLWFHWMDAIAHIDYTLSIAAFSYESPRSLMAAEYMRWRVDEEKLGDRPLFKPFINWLKSEHPDTYARLPALWQGIYSDDDPAQYRSFRIVLDPGTTKPMPATFFHSMIDEFFKKDLIKSIYTGASLSRLFETFKANHQ